MQVEKVFGSPHLTQWFPNTNLPVIDDKPAAQGYQGTVKITIFRL